MNNIAAPQLASFHSEIYILSTLYFNTYFGIVIATGKVMSPSHNFYQQLFALSKVSADGAKSFRNRKMEKFQLAFNIVFEKIIKTMIKCTLYDMICQKKNL